MFDPRADQSTRISRFVYGMCLVVFAWSVSVEVILRRDFGCRYLGAQAAAAAVLIPAYWVFWPEWARTPMYWFWILYISVAAGEWLRAHRRTLRGQVVHSRYSGWPRLLMLTARLSEVAMKKFVEPAMVLGIGWLITDHDKALGWYLMIASGCLFLSNLPADLWIRRRAMDLNDAVFDQQDVTERFRRLRGE